MRPWRWSSWIILSIEIANALIRTTEQTLTMPDISHELAELLRLRDPRFVGRILSVRQPNVLGEVVGLWTASSRAWEASEAVRYLLSTPTSRGHEVVVRQLIRNAIHDRRDRVVTASMVYADRLMTRKIAYAYRHVEGSRHLRAVPVVRRHSKRIRPIQGRSVEGRSVDQRLWDRSINYSHSPTVSPPERKIEQLFSLATRHYLRRSIWRYIRSLAMDRPADYVRAIGFALRQYTDADTSNPLALIECVGLLKVCYRHTPVLTFTNRGADIANQKKLLELWSGSPSPAFADAWKSEVGREEWTRIARVAKSWLVKNWATKMQRLPR
jgi:hypothetical protein